MAEEKEKGTRYVGLDLDTKLFDRLKAIAEADQRTLVSLLRVIIVQWLAEHDKAEQSPGTISPVQHKMIRIKPEEKK